MAPLLCQHQVLAMHLQSLFRTALKNGYATLKPIIFKKYNPISTIANDIKISIASAFKYPPNVFIISFPMTLNAILLSLGKNIDSFTVVKILKNMIGEELAIKKYNVKNMIIAGGVSANKYLRQEIKKVTDKYGVDLSVPSFVYCTDNAAMIGAAAYPLYLNGEFADLSLNATSSDELY